MSGENTDWGQEATNGRGRSPSPSANRRSRSPEQRRPEEENRGRPSSSVAQNPGNNLHISGLSTKVEERDLEDLFSKYGRVAKAQVMRDPHTKDPRGFAFVTMETAEDAEQALQSLNATELMGKVISVERARRGRARTPTPGAYHGPPKRDFTGSGRDRPYGERDRYSDRRDDRGYDRGYGGGRDSRDDRYGSSRRDDYDRSYAAPMRGDDRGSSRYDDRGSSSRYDDRRYESRSSRDDYRSSRY